MTAARAEVTAKVANVTRQNAETVSGQLMAIWNGFRVSAEEAEVAIDKIAGVASKSASNLQELSVGMGKVASMANQMGVTEEQLASMLGTMISVTRQSPETVGTALKSILNRVTDIKAGEGDISLGTYSKKMQELGIEVLDETNKLREMGNVIEEIGSKWKYYSKEEQRALANTMGGAYQANMVTALFENFDEYERLMSVAANSTGELQAQQDIYIESTAAKLQQLSTTWENLFDSLLSGDTVGEVADIFTVLVNGVTNFVDGIGGGKTVLLAFGSIITKIFSNDLSRGLSNAIIGFQNLIKKTKDQTTQLALYQELERQGVKKAAVSDLSKEILEQKIKYNEILTENEKEQYNYLFRQSQELENQKTKLDQIIQTARKRMMAGGGIDFDVEKFIKDDEYIDSPEYDKVLTFLDSFEEGFLENDRILKQYIKTLKTIAPELKQDTKISKQLESVWVKINNNISNKKTISKVLREDFEIVLNQAKELASLDLVNEQGETPEFQKQLQNAIRNLEKERDKVTFKFDFDRENVQQQIKEVVQTFQNANSQLGQYTAQMWEGTTIKLRDYLRNLNLSEEQIKNILKEQNKLGNLRLKINGAVQIIGDLGQIASGIMSISSLFKILQDDSLSVGEKIVQTMSSIGMTIPMLITGIKGIASALQTMGIASSMALGPLSAIVAAAAAALTGIAALFSWFVKDFYSYEEEAKKATESAKQLRQEYEQLKQENESLKDSFKEYNEIKNTLDSLAYATSAWNTEFEKLDKSVSQLLQKYPELKKYMTIGENGEYIISAEAQENVIKERQNREYLLAIASEKSNIEAQRKNNFATQVDTSNMIFDKLSENQWGFNSDGQLNFWRDIVTFGTVRADSSKNFRNTYDKLVQAVADQGMSAIDSVDKIAKITGETFEKAQEIGNIIQDEEIKNYIKNDGERKREAQEEENRVAQITAQRYFDIMGIEKNINDIFLSTQMINDEIDKKISSYGNNKQDVIKKGKEYYGAIAYNSSSGKMTLKDGSEQTVSYEDLKRIVAINDIVNDPSIAENLERQNEIINSITKGNEKLKETMALAVKTNSGKFQDLGTKSQVDMLKELKNNKELYNDALKIGLDIDEITKKWEDSFNKILDSTYPPIKNFFENNKQILEDLTLDEITDLNKTILIALRNGMSMDEIQNYFNTGNTIDNLNNLRNTLGLTSKSIEKFSISLSELKSILENLETGEAISPEDYNKIYSVLKEKAQEYFLLQENGTYKLVRGASELLELAEGIKFENSKENFSNLLKSYGNEEKRENLQKVTKGRNIEELSPNEQYKAIQAVEDPDLLDRFVTPDQLNLLQQLEEGTKKINDLTKDESKQLEDVAKKTTDIVAGTEEGAISLKDQAEMVLSQAENWEQVQSILKLLKGILPEEEIEKLSKKMADLFSFKGIDSKELNTVTKYLQKQNKDLEENEGLASKVAASTIKMNKATEELNTNWDQWIKNLENSNSQLAALAEKDISNNLKDLIGFSGEGFDITSDFIKDNKEIIELAFKGDEASITQLQNEVYEKFVKPAIIEAHPEIKEEELDNLRSQIEEKIKDLEAGKINYEQFNNSLTDMYKNVKGAKEAMETILKSFSYVPEVASQNVELFGSMGEINLEGSMGPALSTILNAVSAIQPAFTGAIGGVPSIVSGAIGNAFKLVGSIVPGAKKMLGSLGLVSIGPNAKISAHKGTPIKVGSGNAKSKGSGGGSKGGGGGSSSKPSQIKPKTSSKDIYKDINRQLTKSGIELDKIQKKQDLAWGTSKLTLYRDELRNTNKELDLLEKKRVINQGELSGLYAEGEKLGFKFSGVDPVSGVREMLNYEAMKEKADADYNKMVNWWNSLSGEQQQDEKNQKIKEQAEEDFEKYEEFISKYEASIGLKAEIDTAILEAQLKKIDMQIKEWQYEVQLRINWGDFKRNALEGQKIFDQAFDYSLENNMVYQNQHLLNKAKTYVDTKELDAKAKQMQDMTKWQAEMNKGIYSKDNKYVSFDKEGNPVHVDMEKFRQEYDELLETLVSDMQMLYDLQKEAYENYLNSIDQAIDMMDKQYEIYNSINDQIEHNLTMIDLLMGENAFGARDAWYNQRDETLQKQLTTLMDERERVQKMMYQVPQDSEEFEKLKARWLNLTNEINSTVEAATQNIITKYQNTVSKIMDDWQKRMTGNSAGFDGLLEDWELLSKKNDFYLDEINSVYNVQKFMNKANDAIDNTTNVKQQQKIRDLMEEQVKFLKDKEKITQYDIDRANKLLDIEIKRQALEDAKNNKTNMRLRRDSQGNYTYQFVADEDEIAKAEQDLADAENDLYNFDKERANEVKQEIIELGKEMAEEIKEIHMDQTLSAEEKERRINQVNEYYTQMIKDRMKEYNITTTNLQSSYFASLEGMYNRDNQLVEEMTGKNIDSIKKMSDEELRIMFEQFVPGMDSAIDKAIESWNGPEGFEQSVKDVIKELEKENKGYHKSIEELAQKAGKNLDDIANGWDGIVEQTKSLLKLDDDLAKWWDTEISKAKKLYEALKKITQEKLKYLNSTREEAAIKGDEAYSDAISGIEKGHKFTSQILNTKDDRQKFRGYKVLDTALNAAQGLKYDPKTDGSATNEAREDDLVGGATYYQVRGKKTRTDPKTGKVYTVVGLTTDPNSDGSDGNWYWYRTEWFDRPEAFYKTGGYTGTWNDKGIDKDNGKLAVLHQKELVLNENDTKNLLETVDIINQLYNKIKQQNQESILSENIANSISDAIFEQINKAQYQQELQQAQKTYEQLKNIDKTSAPIVENNTFNVSFPAAKDHNEIELAIENLKSRASQRNANQIR